MNFSVNYNKLIYGDTMNGEGVRLSIWLSGCPHHCPGCFAKETWDRTLGMDVSDIAGVIDRALRDPRIEGLTLLGGEPLAPYNYEYSKLIAKLFKDAGKSVIIYTGYKWENIPYEIDNLVDTYVDGMYIDSLKCDTEGKGSSNQRFIKKINNVFKIVEELY